MIDTSLVAVFVTNSALFLAYKVRMARRVSHEGAECPVARAADIIGDRWSLLLVRDAFVGITRFSDFQRSLGLARNILASRLKDLVTAGILEVVPAGDGSAYHEYALTETRRELFSLIVALRQWGEDQVRRPGSAHSSSRTGPLRLPADPG